MQVRARHLGKNDLRKLFAQIQAVAKLKPSAEETSAADHRRLAELPDLKPPKKRGKKHS